LEPSNSKENEQHFCGVTYPRAGGNSKKVGTEMVTS
jgi:hypothetical protein